MMSQTSVSLDSLDHAILAILQAEGRLGVTEVGRRINLSQPAVSARIKRLEQSGVITGYRAIIDPARLGLSIHAMIRLRTTHARIPPASSTSRRCPRWWASIDSPRVGVVLAV